jgi:8-oxo-dGTP pyrophosphatase MutT (NUDIX family)
MAHINEKIDFTTSVYIVHENKILLHIHKVHRTWLAPGGHVELHEDPNEAALREAKEETGLDVELVGNGHQYDSPYQARDLILPRFLNRHFYDKTRTHEHVDMSFFARPVSDISMARPEEENGELRWFTKDELERNDLNVLADVRGHALAALKELAS